jgi:hypothetical protein
MQKLSLSLLLDCLSSEKVQIIEEEKKREFDHLLRSRNMQENLFDPIHENNETIYKIINFLIKRA